MLIEFTIKVVSATLHAKRPSNGTHHLTLAYDSLLIGGTLQLSGARKVAISLEEETWTLP